MNESTLLKLTESIEEARRKIQTKVLILTLLLGYMFGCLLSCSNDDNSSDGGGLIVKIAPPDFSHASPEPESTINDFSEIVVSLRSHGGPMPDDITVSEGNIAEITNDRDDWQRDFINVRIIGPFDQRGRHPLIITWDHKSQTVFYDFAAPMRTVKASEQGWSQFEIFPDLDEVISTDIDAIKIDFAEKVTVDLQIRERDGAGNAVGEDYGWAMENFKNTEEYTYVKFVKGRGLAEGSYIIEGTAKNDFDREAKISIAFDTQSTRVEEIIGKWEIVLHGRTPFEESLVIRETEDITPWFRIIPQWVKIDRNELTIDDNLRWDWVVTYRYQLRAGEVIEHVRYIDDSGVAQYSGHNIKLRVDGWNVPVSHHGTYRGDSLTFGHSILIRK